MDKDKWRTYGSTWHEYEDDVTSGTSAADYHVKWSASEGTFANIYGTTVQWKAPDWKAGSNDRSITITVSIDDFNRGDDLTGYNDAGIANTYSQKVWQVTLEVRQSGTRSDDNDGAIGENYGGTQLGLITPGNPTGATGFFGATEVKGTTGGTEQTGFAFVQSKQGSRGSRKSDGTWVITDVPLSDDTATGNNALFYDQDTRHNGADTRHIFLYDAPGVDLNGDTNADGWTDSYTNMTYRTTVLYGGLRVSNETMWRVMFNLSNSNNRWVIAGSHTPN